MKDKEKLAGYCEHGNNPKTCPACLSLNWRKKSTKPVVRKEESDSSPEYISLEEAETILGKENFFGPQEIRNVFGTEFKEVPPIPFSKEELERARELGQQLILQVDKMEGSGNKMVPITQRSLHSKYLRTEKQIEGEYEFLFDDDGGVMRKFTVPVKPRLGWRLTTFTIPPETTGKDYVGQTSALAEYLKDKVFLGEEVPDQYKNAIEQFERQESTLIKAVESDHEFADKGDYGLMKKNKFKSPRLLTELQFNQLTREYIVEVMYRAILNDRLFGKRVCKEGATCTLDLDTRFGELTKVGRYKEGGTGINSATFQPWAKYYWGTSFSRGK